MAIRLTTKFVNELAAGKSLREILADCTFYLYSQSQPADADSGPNGIMCVLFTLDGGAYVVATQSVGTLTIAGGAGNVLTVTVGNMAQNLLAATVPYNTTAGQTATDIAASINSKANALGITAEAVGAVVNLIAPTCLGAGVNGLLVASTVDGTTTATPAAFGSGVDAVNGLNFEFPADGGIIVKPSAEVWKGLGLADDNAGWFRIVAGGDDVSADGADNVRLDGLVATSGGDIQTGSNVITIGATQTIGTLSIQIPRVRV
jgi:hypothetical protein